MRKNITYVDASKFELIVNELGLTAIPQAGYVKCGSGNGRHLYVAKTKRVGRVDLSAFEVPSDLGVTNLGGEKFGNVTQQLDFSRPEEEILASFRKVCEHMISLPPVEKVSRAKPAGEAKPKAQGWSQAVIEMSPEEKQKRADLIARVAAEKGVKVSKKAKHAKQDEASAQS
jgi:hypothetical protein